jgi:predicted AAA+ superfamily ATPase
MDKLRDSIISWNPWWFVDFKPKNSINRDILGKIIPTFVLPHIKDIIGVRRCGKSTLLDQIIAVLIDQKISPDQILFISFEDPVLKLHEIDEIIDSGHIIHPNIQYLFIDEIQEKPGWQLWVKKYYDQQRFKQIFVSSSNASLLSEDISRALTGRHLSFFLTPFTFVEYLYVNQWKENDSLYSEYHFPQLLHLFERYLQEGGFPGTFFLSPAFQHQVLVQLYNDIIYRDIATRINGNIDKIHSLLNYLFTNFTREFTASRIAKALQIHPETVDNYVTLIKNVFLVDILHLYSYKQTIQFRSSKKIYCVDNGLRNAIAFRTTQDFGKMAENLVYNTLKRIYQELYYWKDDKNEIDFLIATGSHVHQLIQVSWDLTDKNTLERELKAFSKAKKIFPEAECLLLSRDINKIENFDGIDIICKPLALWLIEIEKSNKFLEYQKGE